MDSILAAILLAAAFTTGETGKSLLGSVLSKLSVCIVKTLKQVMSTSASGHLLSSQEASSTSDLQTINTLALDQSIPGL